MAVWTLIDVATVGILVVGVLDWNTFVFDHWLRLAVGAALALAGGGFALWGIRHLSWHASLGLEAELVRTGPYRFTRNPQYGGDILMLVGWGILFDSFEAWILCAMAIAWFALAPLAEEAWLREQYGEPYEAYRREVPRFLGRPAAACRATGRAAACARGEGGSRSRRERASAGRFVQRSIAGPRRRSEPRLDARTGPIPMSAVTARVSQPQGAGVRIRTRASSNPYPATMRVARRASGGLAARSRLGACRAARFAGLR